MKQMDLVKYLIRENRYLSFFSKAIVLALLVFINLSCSGKRTDTVTFQMQPESPIVINADFTTLDIEGNKMTISAPWFHFYVKIVNNSPDTVTIVTLTGKITSNTAANGGGGFESKEFSFDTTGSLKRSYVAEVKSGASEDIDIPFYIYGLPKGDNKTFSYSGYFELVGWVGAHNKASGRLVTYPVYFSTE